MSSIVTEFKSIDTPLLEEDTEMEVSSASDQVDFRTYQHEIDLSLIPLQELFEIVTLDPTAEAMVPYADQSIIELEPAPLSNYAESEPEVADANQNMEERNEEMVPLPEPTQDDIDAWMSPRRARDKQLLLNGQYRIVGKLRQQNKTKDGTIDKLRAKNSQLKSVYKCERMRRMAAEKTMNDILKMLEK